ncbi:MAG: metallophosphoesterase [Chitinophagaceae bacterium]|nr:metallophosphoesterase [Chitinophagaceae bacterium]
MNRRIFLKNITTFTGGLIAIGAMPAAAFSLTGKKCRGKVLSKGKGVKGVVVSDGYSVITTDSLGKYEFEWNSDATAVFISTPAGYAFANENNIARHYRLVQDVMDKEVDFDLVPLNKSDNEHEFLIWADPQVKNMKDVGKMLKQSVPDVQNWVAAKTAGELLHGICVGDIVWDSHELFPQYEKAVAQMNIPFFSCIGNHDMDYNNGGDETSDDTFQKLYGPCDYSFNRGKVHYVVMDNVRYMGKDREYDGFFAERQLNWLKKDLSFVPADHLIIFCAHIPVHSGVKNKQDLYNVFGDRKVHIMTGHTHYHVNDLNNNIYEHNHGTVCGAWWTGPICTDGTPCGYGVYKVVGTELSWFYKSVGQKADHQISASVITTDSGTKQIVVNIWNYDPAWKNEYKVNGISKGSLEQFTGYDPVAYGAFLGPNMPAARGFAEPKLTDHLFRAVLPAEAKEVVITATDRFGKEYTLTHHVS